MDPDPCRLSFHTLDPDPDPHELKWMQIWNPAVTLVKGFPLQAPGGGVSVLGVCVLQVACQNVSVRGVCVLQVR
jgi:hypothetical protein